MGLAGAGLVPGVDLRLQLIALGEQVFVLRRQVVDHGFHTGPELVGGNAGPGDGFVVNEVEQHFGDLQATDLNALSHCLPHFCSEPALDSEITFCSPGCGILHDAAGKASGLKSDNDRTALNSHVALIMFAKNNKIVPDKS
ncbi:hypothetical protein D3C81_1718850 [compost metagenome]